MRRRLFSFCLFSGCWEGIEPTSALDEETMKKVEKSLVGMVHDGVVSFNSRPKTKNATPSLTRARHQQQSGGTLKALVWITHEASQAKRVGTREFDVSAHNGVQ